MNPEMKKALKAKASLVAKTIAFTSFFFLLIAEATQTSQTLLGTIMAIIALITLIAGVLLEEQPTGNLKITSDKYFQQFN